MSPVNGGFLEAEPGSAAPATYESAAAKAHYRLLLKETSGLYQAADLHSDKNLLSQFLPILMRGAPKKTVPVFPYRL